MTRSRRGGRLGRSQAPEGGALWTARRRPRAATSLGSTRGDPQPRALPPRAREVLRPRRRSSGRSTCSGHRANPDDARRPLERGGAGRAPARGAALRGLRGPQRARGDPVRRRALHGGRGRAGRARPAQARPRASSPTTTRPPAHGSPRRWRRPGTRPRGCVTRASPTCWASATGSSPTTGRRPALSTLVEPPRSPRGRAARAPRPLAGGRPRRPRAARGCLPGYLYSASELLDRAADLAAESAALVHDNERRWRVFRERVATIVSRHRARRAREQASSVTAPVAVNGC